VRRGPEQRGNHLNTGALGTSVLLRQLSAQGHLEVAHAIATRRTYPSWGYWFENGADTMWEMWPLDSRSRDHYFLGTVVQWLYENVAGLRPGDAGYRTFTVRPDAPTGVDWARTSVHTVRGEAAAAWSVVDGSVRLSVRVPVGATAEVHVPARTRSAVTAPAGAAFVRSEPGFVVYEVAHGGWEFVARAHGEDRGEGPCSVPCSSSRERSRHRTRSRSTGYGRAGRCAASACGARHRPRSGAGRSRSQQALLIIFSGIPHTAIWHGMAWHAGFGTAIRNHHGRLAQDGHAQ
jgi:hypothetical protein